MPDADILESIVASGQYKADIYDITNARIWADNGDNWKMWLK